MKISILDYVGPETRHAAGMTSMEAALLDPSSCLVFFRVGFSQSMASNVAIVQSPLQPPGLPAGGKVYDVTVTAPLSPSGNSGGIASISVMIGGATLEIADTGRVLSFEYVGTQFLYVSPPSGMLNPGSGGLELQIGASNLPLGSPVSATVGGSSCPVSLQRETATLYGTQFVIVCRAPELPMSLAPSVDIVLTSGSITLTHAWTYLLPPEPFIDLSTLTVKGITQAWIPAYKYGNTATVMLRNVNPSMGIPVDEVNVGWGEGGIIEYPAWLTRIGKDIRVTFPTVSVGATPAFALRFIALFEGEETAAIVKDDSGADTARVEVRDINVPFMPLARPSEGPSRGGSLVLAALTGIPTVLEPDSTIACSIFGSSCDVVGVVRLSEWESKAGASYQALMADLSVFSFVNQLSDKAASEFSLVASAGRNTAELALDPGPAGDLTALALIRMGKYTGSTWDQSNGGRLYTSSAQLLIRSAGQTEGGTYLSVMFAFAKELGADTSVAVVTDLGSATSGLKGGVRAVATLTNFTTVFAPQDISVAFTFAAKGQMKATVVEVQVSRLRSSNHEATVVEFVVPPTPFYLPGEATVSLQYRFNASLLASSIFTYFDDRVSTILSVSPFLYYATGGSLGNITVTLVAGIPLKDIFVLVRQGLVFSKTVPATAVIDAPLGTGEDAAIVTFAVPSAAAGTYQVCAQKKYTKYTWDPVPCTVLSDCQASALCAPDIAGGRFCIQGVRDEENRQ